MRAAISKHLTQELLGQRVVSYHLVGKCCICEWGRVYERSGKLNDCSTTHDLCVMLNDHVFSSTFYNGEHSQDSVLMSGLRRTLAWYDVMLYDFFVIYFIVITGEEPRKYVSIA